MTTQKPTDPAFWLPKKFVPPSCRAGGHCQFINDSDRNPEPYSWYRVFISVPYESWYEPYRKAIVEAFDGEEFIPVFVDKASMYATSTIGAICRLACSSEHAIVDLSSEDKKGAARGVCLEVGQLGCKMPDEQMLHLKQTGHVVGCAELNQQTYNAYETPDELNDLVREFLRRQKKQLEAVNTLVFSSDESSASYTAWYHCRTPSSSGYGRDRVDPIPNPITGGESGVDLLRRTFDQLKPNGHEWRCEYCSDDEEAVKDLPQFLEDKSCFNDNLFLFDAPGSEYNWVTEGILRDIGKTLASPLKVRFDNLNKKEAKNYPKENKKIQHSGTNESYISTRTLDFGVIQKLPSPYHKDRHITVMAGNHAPATHMAAEALVTPREASKLVNSLRSEKFFECIFSIDNSYDQVALRNFKIIHVNSVRQRYIPKTPR